MRPQSPENHRPHHQGNAGYPPEAEGHPPVFPKPDLVDETVPIPFDNVEDRVELHYKMIGRGETFQVPENGGQVEAHLENHAYKWAQVAEKDNH